jgi:hypothetical protein
MARKGRLDRGLMQKRDASGKIVWFVRLYHEGIGTAIWQLFDEDRGARLLREGQAGAKDRAVLPRAVPTRRV